MSNPQIGNRYINEFHKDIVKSVGALPTPTAALAGFRRFRTSDNLEYYCDGSKWLSTQVFDVTIANKFSSGIAQGTTSFAAPFNRFHSLNKLTTDNGVYLVGLDCAFVPVSTTQDNSNYYTLTGLAQAHNSSPAQATITLSGTVDTKTFTTTNRPYEMNYTLSQLLLSPYHRPALVMTPTGTPGTFNFEATLSYRIVGT